MTRLFCLCFTVLLGLSVSPLAQASAVDTVRFVQPAKVVVWDEIGDMRSGTEVALDDVPHVLPADYVMTGTLLPIEASANVKQHEMTVRLASNTAVTLFASPQSDIRDVRVQVIASGPNAKAAGDMLTEAAFVPARVKTPIFSLTKKTAARPGAAISQSITLKISWTGEATPEFLLAAQTR